MGSILSLSFVNVVADDANWLKTKGSLIFQDTFDHKVKGNGLKGSGNGWESAAANQVPQIRQADVIEGVILIN